MNKRKTSSFRRSAKISADSLVQNFINESKKTLLALWQRPLGSALTIFVIALSLLLPASFYTAAKNIADLSSNVTDTSKISVYLQSRTPEARLMVLKDDIENWPTVASVDYVSSQQGLEEISQFSGLQQSLSLLSETALPPVLVILPEKSAQNDESVSKLVSDLQNKQDVTDVRVDEDWFSRLDAMERLATVIMYIFIILMLISVFLIVGNTLRFNILAHKEEIQVMKLIGATDRFILRPYLFTGFWLGLIGAFVATILNAWVLFMVSGAVDDLAALYDSQFTLSGLSFGEVILLLMLGSLLGWGAANSSTKKHLKEIEPV